MKENLQSIGPISNFELKKLHEFFELNKITFETEIDVDLKAEADVQLAAYGNGDYDPLTRRTINTFDYNNARFFYVYLNSEDALKTTAFLHNLTLSLNRETVGLTAETAEELLEAEDYMCVECSYHSQHPGVCPKHGVTLMPYFDWVKAKKERDAKSPLAAAFNFLSTHIIYVLCILFLGYYLIYRLWGD